MISFNTDAIRTSNRPEDVLSQLNIPFVRKGDKLKAACPGCGKDKKFDYTLSKDVYNCFSCDFGGSGVISFVMDVLGRNFVEACQYLGGGKDLTPEEEKAAEDKQREWAETAKKEEANKRRRTRKQMEDIIGGSQPGAGTLAQTYLETRGHGLGLSALGWPKDILFHPGLEAFIGEGKDRQAVGIFPTMISKGRDAKGKLVLLHRTFLQPARPEDGPASGMVKAAPVLPAALADDWNAKQMVGVLSLCDHGVYLGATNDVTDDPNQPIIVAEGIESTLAMATAGVRGAFYAALSLNRLVGSVNSARQRVEGWRPPEAGRPIVIACDNDLSPTAPHFEDYEIVQTRGGPKKVSAERAQAMFTKAGQRLADLGHTTGLFFPPLGCDPEDALLIDPETENPNEKDFQGSIDSAPDSVPGTEQGGAEDPETPDTNTESEAL